MGYLLGLWVGVEVFLLDDHDPEEDRVKKDLDADDHIEALDILVVIACLERPVNSC